MRSGIVETSSADQVGLGAAVVTAAGVVAHAAVAQIRHKKEIRKAIATTAPDAKSPTREEEK